MDPGMSNGGLAGYSPPDSAHRGRCFDIFATNETGDLARALVVRQGTIDFAMTKHDPPPERVPPDDADAEPTTAQLASAAGTFALLASPTRLHLVWLVAQGSYDVGTLARRVGISIATVSQHLGKLRLAGVITVRRQGRHHIYAVEDPHVLTLVDQIFEHIAPDGSLAPDPPRRH
jgi:DNA-binding transcriptional ArsR family regulator